MGPWMGWTAARGLFRRLAAIALAALLALPLSAQTVLAAPSDPASVLRRHTPAALAGNREALRTVAKAIVALGPRSVPSAASLRPRLRSEAQRGSSASSVAYGILLQYGIGGAPAMREAPGWYERAARAGNRSGAQRAAVAYALGWGVDRDTRRALNLLSRLKPEARAKQMVVISEAMLRPEQYEPEAAEDWLERALALETRSTLKAVSLFEGIEFGGVDRSREIQAFLRGRAEKGDARAALHLGRRLVDGTAAERVEAVSWLVSAVDSGEPHAAPELRRLVADASVGMSAGGADIRAAAEKAASQGSGAARAALAQADAFSLTAEPGRTEDATYLADAARDGDAQAQYRMGMLFLVDTTRPENAAVARAYLSLAAAGGNTLASTALTSLGPMTVTEAKALLQRQAAAPRG